MTPPGAANPKVAKKANISAAAINDSSSFFIVVSFLISIPPPGKRVGAGDINMVMKPAGHERIVLLPIANKAAYLRFVAAALRDGMTRVVVVYM